MLEDLGQGLKPTLLYGEVTTLSLEDGLVQTSSGLEVAGQYVTLEDVYFDAFMSIQIVFSGSIEDGTFI